MEDKEGPSPERHGNISEACDEVLLSGRSSAACQLGTNDLVQAMAAPTGPIK
jgi:hypothetical protein